MIEPFEDKISVVPSFFNKNITIGYNSCFVSFAEAGSASPKKNTG